MSAPACYCCGRQPDVIKTFVRPATRWQPEAGEFALPLCEGCRERYWPESKKARADETRPAPASHDRDWDFSGVSL